MTPPLLMASEEALSSCKTAKRTGQRSLRLYRTGRVLTGGKGGLETRTYLDSLWNRNIS